MTPLLYRALNSVGPDQVPREILDAFQTHCAAIRERNRFLARELLDILAALKGCGVPAIPFKGPVLATQIYGDLALRTFRDLDFLIHEEDLPGTLDVLTARGYAVKGRTTPVGDAAIRKYYGQDLYLRSDGNVAVEPHWALTPSTFAVAIDYPGLWERARPSLLEGTSVLSFAPEDLLIILSVHGSKEQWWRLGWICDVAELIRVHPGMDWGAALERARSQRCRRMVLLALSLTNRVLQTPLPPPVLECMDEDKTVTRLVDQAWEWLVQGQHRGPPSFNNISWFRFRMHERPRDRMSYALRTITTPSARHYGMIALPGWLFFGYYPLKLIHDYLLLPIWMLGKHVLKRLNGSVTESEGSDAAI